MHRHRIFADKPHPRVFAHRGLVTAELAEQGVAENTRAAFAAAIAAGADFIESDIWLTSDGVPVLWHDADLQRVLGDSRAISEVQYEELLDLMASRGGLLSLATALDTFADTRFNFDIKTGTAAVAAGKTLAAHTHRVLVTSFSDTNRMATLKTIAATGAAERPATSAGRSTLIRLLAALAAGGIGVNRILAGVDALQIPERQGKLRVLTPKLISVAHKAGVEVHVWTINDAQRMGELVALGVDGIVTDCADVALTALQSARK